MRIYTRTGDAGETGLFGGGRVSKADRRVDAYGEVDELNACIGCAVAASDDHGLRERLEQVQAELFVVGAQLATPAAAQRGRRPDLPELNEGAIVQLEAWIDMAEAELAPLRHFILPGGSASGAALHLARTVCRRAERAVSRLAEKEPVGPEILGYLNRLSDLLFVLARVANRRAGAAEQTWIPRPRP
ncbi:MAG: cob(I)yrinic acid a,c-diamide adenosyltransferase [Longimicrobiales bacterium]